MEDRTRYTADPRNALREMGLELHFLAGALADLAFPADDDHAPAQAPLSARRVAALLAARARRAEAFGLPPADPHWTLLLELFQAQLERRPLRPAAAADPAPLHRLLALGLAGETRGAWTLTPGTAQALRRQLDDERRALTGR